MVKQRQTSVGIFCARRAIWIAGLFLLFLSIYVFITSASRVSALTTVPTLMNFQGRLTDSTGNIKPNGTYNMKLRLYDAASGGTLKYSEDRLVSAGDPSRVTVTNGIFSLRIGEGTNKTGTFDAALFASGSLYLEVELPTPATATSASPTWTEGPMTPRNQLGTSAYAYNAETLDGFDSASFARTDANNIFTGTQRFDVASATAFDVQNGSAVSVFKVDTVGAQVTIGTSDTTGTVFVLDTKTDAGDPTGVAGAMYYNSNAGKFRCYQGTAWTDCIGAGGPGGGGSTKRITLVPEYAGGVISADGSNNTGTLTSDFDGTNLHNYYAWSSTIGSLNDYDVVVRSAIPSDYASGLGNFKLWVYNTSTSTASNDIQVTVKDGAGTTCANNVSIIHSVASTWSEKSVTLSGCSFSANSILTVSVKMYSQSSNAVRIGEMSYEYTN